VNYSKHYDLSSAAEIWDDFIEGQQYGGVPYDVQRYQLLEYMRKRSAPQEVVDEVKDGLDSVGLPVKEDNVGALAEILDTAMLKAKLNPQLLSDEAKQGLKEMRMDLEEFEDEDEQTVEDIDAENESN
jgi:hypothetical protein